MTQIRSSFAPKLAPRAATRSQESSTELSASAASRLDIWLSRSSRHPALLPVLAIPARSVVAIIVFPFSPMAAQRNSQPQRHPTVLATSPTYLATQKRPVATRFLASLRRAVPCLSSTAPAFALATSTLAPSTARNATAAIASAPELIGRMRASAVCSVPMIRASSAGQVTALPSIRTRPGSHQALRSIFPARRQTIQLSSLMERLLLSNAALITQVVTLPPWASHPSKDVLMLAHKTVSALM